MPLKETEIAAKVTSFMKSREDGTAEAMSEDAYTALFSYVVLELAKDDPTIKWDSKDRAKLREVLAAKFATYTERGPDGVIRFRDQITKPATTSTPAAGLSVSYDYKDQPAVRAEVAAVLGITDKGHSVHGGNSTASRTLKMIIDNLCAPLKNWPPVKQEEASQKLMAKYGYTPFD
jgi:hypothetical protein